MVIVETALYVAIACGERQKAEDRMISFSSDVPTLSLGREVRYVAPFISTGTLEQAISDDLSTIPEVVSVKVDREDNNFLVLVGVAGDNPNRALRDKIFDKEFGLMRAFPEHRFDFNLV